MNWIQTNIKRFSELKSRIDNINIEISKVINENQEFIISLNKDQLLSGRDINGDLLTPGYLEDPYFKTEKQAKWYAGMKYKLESEHKNRINFPQIYPAKPKNTPNLIVTGSFQDRVFFKGNDKEFYLDSTYIDSPDIIDKYNNKVFGLAPQSINYFWVEYLRQKLINYLYV